MEAARVHSINVSDGGVPKQPVASAQIGTRGLEGDRQRNRLVHGGPARAVVLYSLELIEALQAEGHPIAPGTIGENLTLSGLDWVALSPGTQLDVGEVRLEITKPASPCASIAGSFAAKEFARVSHERHPGWSRLCARVLQPGRMRLGDAARIAE